GAILRGTESFLSKIRKNVVTLFAGVAGVLHKENGNELVAEVDLHVRTVGATMPETTGTGQVRAALRPAADRPSQAVPIATAADQLPCVRGGHPPDGVLGEVPL